MANEIPELKPCPFCSGNAEIQEGIIYGHYVECNSCELTLGVGYGSDGEWNGYFDGVGDAFRAWNTRTAPKVKPLVWSAGFDGSQAETIFGSYEVSDPDSTGRCEVTFAMDSVRSQSLGHIFSDHASKAKCQDHHNSIVASLIE